MCRNPQWSQANTRFLSCAKVNHKPSQIGPRRVTTLTQTGDDYSLTIRDGEVDDEISKVSYTGHRAEQHHSADSYVLVFDRKQQSFTLNPVDGDYSFNISATPWHSKSEDLADHYKQIPKDSGLDHDAASPGHAHSSSDNEGDLFGGHDAEPDTANPFDFRHFLDAPPASPVVPAARAPSSTVNTPMRLANSPMLPSNSTFGKHSPMLKAKASPLMKPNKHRRNISTSSLGPGRAAADASSKTKTKPAPDEKPVQSVPRVQLQRKASVRSDTVKAKPKAPRTDADDGDDDDDNKADADDDILIIEGEEDEPEEKAHTPAFRGTPNGGAPVSLSQLATSNSPAGFDRSDDEYDDEIEVGGTIRNDDDDDDVQSISLGTPAHRGEEDTPASSRSRTHLSVPSTRAQAPDDNDAEDDQVVLALEAELLSGLESEDEDEDDGRQAQAVGGTTSSGLPPSSLRQVQAEESDESEEE